MTDYADKTEQLISDISRQANKTEQTVADISRLAATEMTPPDNLSCPERCLFYALHDVYMSFKRGTISQEQGAERKKQAVKQYLSDCETEQQHRAYILSHAQLWKRIESAKAAYMSDKCIDRADRFIEAVYNTRLAE